MNKIPEDVIINHILPYTYLPQSKLLTTHIKCFTETLPILFKIIDNEPEPNTTVSLVALLYVYCNSTSMIFGINNRFIEILRRNKTLNNKSDTKIIKYIYNNLQYMNSYIQVKILWGLLKPSEQMDFLENTLYIP